MVKDCSDKVEYSEHQNTHVSMNGIGGYVALYGCFGGLQEEYNQCAACKLWIERENHLKCWFV